MGSQVKLLLLAGAALAAASCAENVDLSHEKSPDAGAPKSAPVSRKPAVPAFKTQKVGADTGLK